MRVRASSTLAAPIAAVREVVEDLTRCPEWLSFVLSADPAQAAPGDGGPAWIVELGARIGPLRRAKRVRMVRATCTGDTAGSIRFERREVDGRPHSDWVLKVDVRPEAQAGTELTGELFYGGKAWLPGLDALVARELRTAGARLAALLPPS